MKQISLATTGFELVTKRTRKRVFLDEMNLVVPWTELVGLIQPFAPSGGQEHGATDNTVCLEQLVDGQKAHYSGNPGMSAPAKPITARQMRKKASHPSQYAQNFDEIAFCNSLNNCLTANSCFGGGDVWTIHNA